MQNQTSTLTPLAQRDRRAGTRPATRPTARQQANGNRVKLSGPTAWTETQMARVSSDVISRMTRRQLEEFVWATARQFLDPRIAERLKHQDRATLVRLAYLGRRCSQNRLRRRREAAA